MANYAISASQLTEGSTVHVRGKLAYGRLTRLIEGAELAASDQRKVQNGMNAVGKPHTTATIIGAEVVYADPDNPTTEEKFVAERRYASKKNPDTGANYSIDSKGNNLPIIAVPSETNPGTYEQDTSGRELAQGLDVTLALRVYKPKNFANRGLALDQVIVHETPRYYSAGGVDTADLKARGIVFNTPPRPMQASEVTPVGEAQPDPVGTDVEDGLSFPSPQPTAAPAPQQQTAQPAAPQEQAPAPQAAPQSAPHAQQAAPSQQAVEETIEEKLARLEKENASLKDAGSAVGAPAAAGPWNGPGQNAQAGITYNG